MPDLRTDWLTGRTVLVAENRALRPNEFNADERTLNAKETASAIGQLRDASQCPFCPGHESETPPPTFEQFDEAHHWRLRVIPNKYPAVALDRDGDDTADVSRALSTSPFATTYGSALGAHEVIIESAQHIECTGALSELELRNVLRTYAERLSHWREDERFAYGLVFKNQGQRAGASLAHLHSQLLALPAIPPAVEAELAQAQGAFQQHGSCPYCRRIEEERAADERVVFERDGFLAFCPFASLQPHEVWILPTVHESSFERSMPAGALERLATVLHPLIVGLESLVAGKSFNLLLRTGPWKVDCDNWFHWRIELLPRVNSIAGLEVATGLNINPLAPERAAKDLRKLL